METPPPIDTKRRLAGWIILGFSIVVAIICVVRGNASASNLLGCAFAALVGIIFVGESVSSPDDTTRKPAPNYVPKWMQWLFVALFVLPICLALFMAFARK